MGRNLNKDAIFHRWGWTVFTLFFIGLLVFCLIINTTDNRSADIIAIVGSVASIAGILVAIYQVWLLSTRTAAVESALNAAKERLAGITIFSDINSHSQFIREIQVYIRSSKHEEALVTYKDLKERLCKLLGYIEGRDELKDQYKTLKMLVGDAGNDVNNLNKIVMKTSSSPFMDTVRMVDNLENIKTLLDTTSGKLSRENYERTGE